MHHLAVLKVTLGGHSRNAGTEPQSELRIVVLFELHYNRLSLTQQHTNAGCTCPFAASI